jgi:hypothetical protein
VLFPGVRNTVLFPSVQHRQSVVWSTGENRCRHADVSRGYDSICQAPAIEGSARTAVMRPRREGRVCTDACVGVVAIISSPSSSSFRFPFLKKVMKGRGRRIEFKERMKSEVWSERHAATHASGRLREARGSLSFSLPIAEEERVPSTRGLPKSGWLARSQASKTNTRLTGIAQRYCSCAAHESCHCC